MLRLSKNLLKEKLKLFSILLHLLYLFLIKKSRFIFKEISDLGVLWGFGEIKQYYINDLKKVFSLKKNYPAIPLYRRV